MDSHGEEENNDQDYPEISERELHNEEDNADKLNLNTKKIESSRDEFIPKEEKTEDKQTKENIEKTLEKEHEEKNEEMIEENKEEHHEEKQEDNINNEKQEEKKEETPEDKQEKKSEDLLQTLEKKVKLPIVPYKVSESYPQTLINMLKGSDRLRPKTLLAPEMGDITRSIDDLVKDEERQLKIEELEDKNVENKERDDKNHFSSYKQSSNDGNTVLQDPFALFYGAEVAYIDQFYKLSDLFVICPLYLNYRISLEYCINETDGKREYAAYHLFNTKETSPPCSHDCCANQAREINLNIFNLTLDPQEKNRKIQKFVTIRKGCRCAFSCLCACCSRPTFTVETPIDNLGKIIETRTVCAPIIHVQDINEDIIYVITTTGGNCGFCCRDQCCDNRKCASCDFIIYDGNDEEMKNPLGTIKKDHKSGRKMMPDYDQLKVVFPPGISCQNKILLVCASLVIEYLYFQNFSNTKRCRGAPRFLNSYSD